MAGGQVAKDRARAGDGRETALEPVGISARFSMTALGSGGMGDAWMGPGRPLSPSAPPEVAGRRWDYEVGRNYHPRRDRAGGITFPQLRGFADGYDLLRLLIETRKDQMVRLKWSIKPRDPKVKVEGETAARVKKVEDFLRRPDRKQWWDAWLRALLEDLFVLDAPTVYRRRTYGGELYALELVDGATIDCLIDDHGRTPEYPNAAYQQRLKGLAAVNYTERDLLYRPRNRRNHKIYGYSPVEQIVMTVNIALRRQMFQLSYYTEGNVPEALIGVPDTWTPEQISAFQDLFDTKLAGNNAQRRRLHFVPSSASKGYQPTKTDNIFGEGEEWLARVVCFAMSCSPQPFVKMMNRATSEQAEESATSEGLVPLKGWLKGFVDEVIADDMLSPDLEFAFEEEAELSPKDQSEMLGAESEAGRITVNEDRVARGLDPYPGEAFNKPMMKTATGWVFCDPADAIADALERQKKLGPPPGAEVAPGADDEDSAPGPKPRGGRGKGPAGGQGAVDGSGKGSAAKAAAVPDPDAAFKAAEIPPDQGPNAPNITRPKARRAEVRLYKAIARAFADIADDVAGQVEQELRRAGKAEGDDLDIEGLLARLQLDPFDVIVDQAREDFLTVADDAGRLALGQIGVLNADDLFEQVNERAQAFAEERSAELVGRQVAPDGTLVDSSNPAMAITDSTRNMIREIIEQGITDNLSADEIADRIQTGATFSADRAKLIAHTEIANANSQGALAGYRVARSAGVDVGKAWLNGSAPCETCKANADAGDIDLDQPFPSGHSAPSAHPRCECALSPVVREPGDQTSAGGA